MGVSVRQKRGDRAWWVFICHRGQRKSKRVGDKPTALKVAAAIRERLARAPGALRRVGGGEPPRNRTENPQIKSLTTIHGFRANRRYSIAPWWHNMSGHGVAAHPRRTP